MLSVALRLVMFSRRRLPSLILTVLLPWASQVERVVGTPRTHAGMLGSACKGWQKAAAEGKPTEAVLGAKLNGSVNGVIRQRKAFLKQHQHQQFLGTN